jgi:hypothetical protein
MRYNRATAITLAEEDEVVSSREQILLVEAARGQGLEPERALAMLTALWRSLGEGAYYVYRSEAATGGKSASTRTDRQILAFASADAALAFAQRNAPTARVRLRGLSVAQLLTLMLHEPSITAVLFVADNAPEASLGKLPRGLRVERDRVLQLLRPLAAPRECG